MSSNNFDADLAAILLALVCIYMLSKVFSKVIVCTQAPNPGLFHMNPALLIMKLMFC